MYWMRSWPWLAAISAAMRAGIWVLSMWSTVTLTPNFVPHSLAKGSNHLSWAGTKWLHMRIFRSPDSFRDGCSKRVAPGAGAGPDAEVGAVSLALPVWFFPHAARSAAAPIPFTKTRRVIPPDSCGSAICSSSQTAADDKLAPRPTTGGAPDKPDLGHRAR